MLAEDTALRTVGLAIAMQYEGPEEDQLVTLVGCYDVRYGALVQARICKATPYEDPVYLVSLTALSCGESS